MSRVYVTQHERTAEQSEWLLSLIELEVSSLAQLIPFDSIGRLKLDLAVNNKKVPDIFKTCTLSRDNVCLSELRQGLDDSRHKP